MADAVTAYARAVERGRIPAGPLHKLACARHLRESGDRLWQAAHGLKWDAAAAARTCAIISRFVQYKGEWAGQPLDLQPWQQFIIGSLFGWKRCADGLRRFRSGFCELPRGNGKSVLAATIGLYGAFLEGEPGADVYSVATKRDQARIVFDHARQMVKRTPALASRIAVQLHNLHQLDSASKFEPLSSDAHTLDGLRPHIVIADEVHAHPDASVIEVMLTGMGTRRQPLMFEITTAGVSRFGPWWAHREYTRGVLEGDYHDDTWFGIVFHAPTEADWTAPAVWAMANPGYGHQVKVDYLTSECRKAQHILSQQNGFRRLHLGQLVEQVDRFLDIRQWDAPAVAAPLDLSALQGRPCYAGLDLSTRIDLTAFVLVFPDADGGITVLPHFWCPEQTIDQRSRVDRVPYRAWCDAGHITATSGSTVDYESVRAGINALAQRFKVTHVCYDPWNAAQLAGQLGSDGLQCVEVRQGVRSMSEPTKTLAALVADRKVRHGGHPMLRWQARNLVVKTDSNGNVSPDKSKAVDKIDGMVALIMGMEPLVRSAPAAEPAYQFLVLGGMAHA